MDINVRLKLVFISLIFLCNTSVAKEEILKLSLFPINPNFKIEQIASAGDYILFKHLNRNLIEIDADGRIYGDLAEKWEISNKHTQFKFKLKNNILFSDQTKITAYDIQKSFQYISEKKGGIHYDFSNIKAIVPETETELIIKLKKSSPRFLRSLTHPEFGVRKISALDTINYKTTSGCYKLKTAQVDKIILEKNNLCTDTKNDIPYVSFAFVKPNEQKDSVLKKQQDFYVSLMNYEDLMQATKNGDYVTESPHIGFSFWITINSYSKKFQKKSVRDKLYNIFDTDLNLKNLNPTVERARQLYLPNGPGRLNAEEIKNLVSKKKVGTNPFKLTSVSILLPLTFENNQDIIDLLKANFKDVKFDFYKNQQEFIDKKFKRYDLFLANNDFSSLDLYENIAVSFNPVRPLIYSNKKIEGYLKKLSTTTADDDTFSLYKKIAESLIQDSLIIPIVHKRVLFLRKKELSIKHWSNIFPEISAWKIEYIK